MAVATQLAQDLAAPFYLGSLAKLLQPNDFRLDCGEMLDGEALRDFERALPTTDIHISYAANVKG